MKIRTARRLALICITFALAAALSACGGDRDTRLLPDPIGGNSPPPPPAPPPPPPPPPPAPPAPPPSAFTMTLSTDRQPVEQGHTERVTVSIVRDATFTGSVEVAVSGLPGGASAASVVIPAGSTSADLVLQADAAAAHSLPTSATVTGTGGGSSAQKPLTVTVRGPAGAVDTSFNGGINVTPIGPGEDFAHAVAIQADGAVLVAGSSAFVTGTDFSVVRYGRDGGLDATFGNGGKVTTAVASGNGSDEAYAVAVQPDGKILVAGNANMGSGGLDFALVRYNADGTLDTTFGNGGKVTTAIGAGTDRAYAILLQPDGRIVLGGDSDQVANGFDFALVRYNTDGSLDPSFGNGGIVTTPIATFGGRDSIYALTWQTVGGESRIVAVGGEGDFVVARYTAAGALDAGFGNGGTVRGLFGSTIGAARGVVATADGKLVVAGHSGHDHALVRLLADGVLDVSFGTAGRSVVAVSANNWDEVQALVQQADGKLVTAGWTYVGNSSSGDYVVTRFTVDGTLDTSFGDDGIVITPAAPGTKSDAAQAVALQADDRVPTVRSIVAGSRNDSNNDFAVVRYWH
jgi:uncharacterized delta-60 repeat protein